MSKNTDGTLPFQTNLEASIHDSVTTTEMFNADIVGDGIKTPESPGFED